MNRETRKKIGDFKLNNCSTKDTCQSGNHLKARAKLSKVIRANKYSLGSQALNGEFKMARSTPTMDCLLPYLQSSVDLHNP